MRYAQERRLMEMGRRVPADDDGDGDVHDRPHRHYPPRPPPHTQHPPHPQVGPPPLPRLATQAPLRLPHPRPPILVTLLLLD